MEDFLAVSSSLHTAETDNKVVLRYQSSDDGLTCYVLKI